MLLVLLVCVLVRLRILCVCVVHGYLLHRALPKKRYLGDGLSLDSLPPHQDNTPCVLLVEERKKFVGIMAALDDRKDRKDATDEAFCTHILDTFGRARGEPPKAGSGKAGAGGGGGGGGNSGKEFLASARKVYGQTGAGSDFFVVCHFAGDIK